METKMTSRDKVLLIVLAIVLVVFGAVMIPTYGIKDLIVSIKDTRTAITQQTSENNELLEDLTKAGVSAAYAESSAQAKQRLKKDILQSKYNAVKFEQTSLSAQAYAVADQWLTPVKYLHFDAGNTVLYTNISVSNNDGGFTEAELPVEDSSYSVERYSCLFSCVTSAEEKYVYELDYLAEDANVNSLALLIAAYDILQERGSVVIEDWTVDETSATMNLSLVIPAGSHIDDYAAEIGECEHCGTPYYVRDYYNDLADLEEGETEVKCADCEQPLTGKALN